MLLGLYLTLMFTFISFNANGLRDVVKVKSVFEHVQNYYCDIVFLQETFWDDDFVR